MFTVTYHNGRMFVTATFTTYQERNRFEAEVIAEFGRDNVSCN